MEARGNALEKLRDENDALANDYNAVKERLAIADAARSTAEAAAKAAEHRVAEAQAEAAAAAVRARAAEEQVKMAPTKAP